MTIRLALALLGVLLVALASPGSASAGWFAGDPVDRGDVLDVDADLARDGAGALAWVKREDGVGHVYLSRLAGGAAQPAVRVDAGIETGATEVAVATVDGGRLVVTWTAGGRLYGAVAPGGDAPLGGPTELGGDAAAGVALDMGINGTAYAAWTAGTDVRAVRLQGTTWEAIAAPLDIDAGRPAGVGAGRPRVAVSAEGNAVATWGEAGQVWARRLTGLSPSLAPQLVSLPELGGVPGGEADSPEIDIEDDGSFAWVAFRQVLGSSRVLARRLVGSAFEAPALIDGGAGDTPDIDLTGRGLGIAAASAAGAVTGALLERDVFGPPLRMDVVGGVEPVVAIAERERAAVVYRREGLLAGRHREEDARALDTEVVLSRPELGAVAEGGHDAAADRVGDFAVPFLQGAPGDRAVSLAVYDRPPLRAQPSTTVNYQRRSRPRFVWAEGIDLWGPQTFTVYVDGQELGRSDRRELVSPRALAEGPHRWRVVSTDRRGQQTVSNQRTVRIDTRPPVVRVGVVGVRRRGRPLRVSLRATDPSGSGVDRVRVEYGDGDVATTARSVHRYRSGRWRLEAVAVDRAGNVGRTQVTVRVR